MFKLKLKCDFFPAASAVLVFAVSLAVMGNILSQSDVNMQSSYILLSGRVEVLGEDTNDNKHLYPYLASGISSALLLAAFVVICTQGGNWG